MTKILLVIGAMFLCSNLTSQIVEGHLNLINNQSIKLVGFKGFKTYPISNTKIDKHGSFKLNYSKSDYGMGYLISEGKKPLILVLGGEDIQIRGESLSYPESISIMKGQQNQWFEQYAVEHPKREQALTAWTYLEKMYNQDPLFEEQQTAKNSILKEKQRIKSADSTFLANLPKDSYLSWYLPTRKLVSSVSTVAKHRPEEIPTTIEAFRSLDYTDERLYKSGLFKDALESHFWLIENSGQNLDAVYQDMKISIDRMMEKLVMDEDKLNEVTDYLFDLLERHSLFKASEYLALKVLKETSCTIDSDLANQLETYRAMKKGNIAPDISFEGYNVNAGNKTIDLPEKLSQINSKYTLVVFGASWCPKCTEELPEINKHYSNWKEQGLEVVFVSLDQEKVSYNEFIEDFPFLSICDFKKWESPVVEDYYVFATPTMYLLNDVREILLRPKSVEQMDAWVDWYLIQGNPMPK